MFGCAATCVYESVTKSAYKIRLCKSRRRTAPRPQQKSILQHNMRIANFIHWRSMAVLFTIANFMVWDGVHSVNVPNVSCRLYQQISHSRKMHTNRDWKWIITNVQWFAIFLFVFFFATSNWYGPQYVQQLALLITSITLTWR